MRFKVSMLLVCAMLAMSCATIFKGTSEEVSMRSDPARAMVFINGQQQGETPLTLKLESKKSYDIEFRMAGYKSKTVHISNHIGAGWLVLDILTGLVPIIVDASTGAWYGLDQKNVDAVLEKQQPR